MYVNYDRQLQYQQKQIRSIIWGQVSDELRATVKSISVFYAAKGKFDAIGMLKIIQKAMLNVQIQKYFPAAVHSIEKRFYYRVK